MLTPHPKRLRSFDYLGSHEYFLTWCCHNRQPLFRESVAVDLVLAQILRAAEETELDVLAYCFMPDHVHLLVAGRHSNSDGVRFINLARQYAGFAYSKQFLRRLWQRYSYEHVLRSHETAQQVAQYIVENPVRAGLVVDLCEYTFTGSAIRDLTSLIEWAYGGSG
jgi:putative transposase